MNDTADDRRFDYLIGIADNALLSGQRLGEWVGHGPQLEEELAMANFALDYVGQARVLFSYAGEVEGVGRDEDQLAFLRDSNDFRNVLLVEQPNGDFAQTIARQFLFESFYALQLEALESSSDTRLSEFAVRAGREIAYHLRHTRQWVLRLGDGTEESRERMQSAIDGLWRYTGEMFSSDPVDEWACEAGVGPRPEALRSAWNAGVESALHEATLERPDDEWMASGGKQGQHSEHHGYILAEMQFMQRAYPESTW